MMKLKKILVILIILHIAFFTGCWSSNEIDTLAITVCIGIDKTEKGYLVSEQVINPKAIASQRALNESPVFLYTEEGRDLGEIIRKLTTQSSRKIYNAHLRMVVFGGDVAKDGIKDILDYFARNYQYRTDFFFVIAKDTTAYEVLSILTPLESIPGIELYKSLKISSENWAPVKSIKIIELINTIIADGINPVITGIEITSGKANNDSTEALRQSDGIKKLLYTDLGVFEKDKLIGWLNEDESKGYNYITGNVKSTVEYAIYDNKAKITGNIINIKSKMKASLINGEFVIDIKIDVKENIEAVEGEFDVSKVENVKTLSEIAEKKIKLFCEKALHKAQNELGTDIFGLGEVIHRKYPKQWEKIKDDWNNVFADLSVNITVEVKTNQLGQVTKPLFIEGEE